MPEDVDSSKPKHVAIAIVCQHGKFLVGIRPPDVPLPGYWEFPGGKVHTGELPAKAAIRECREETGLQVEVRFAYPGCEMHYPHGTIRLWFFHCVPSSDAAANESRSHSTAKEPFMWVSRDGLRELQMPPGNDGVLTQILAK